MRWICKLYREIRLATLILLWSETGNVRYFLVKEEIQVSYI